MSESRETFLSDLLERLPDRQRDIATRLTDAFVSCGAELYLVGGVVRDLLLERGGYDLDFATSAEPELTKRAGALTHPDAMYTVGEAYGTVGFVYGDSAERVLVEITTYRSEVYPTSDRHPQVTHGVDLREDLARRDFTINAIALRAADGQLVDPFRGVADLRRRTIRAVGNARERFQEDPLRVLRAARFAAQLDFAIDEETLNAMRAMGPELQRISQERIAAELNRLLTAEAVARGLTALAEADLIRWVLPEVQAIAEDEPSGARHKDIWEHTVRVVAQSPPRLAVRWAALLHDAAKPMTRSVDERGEVHFFGHELAGASLARKAMRRLKQEKALEDRVRTLVAMHLRSAGYDESWTDSAVRRLALEAGDAFEDLLDLAAADVTSARASRQAAAAARVAGLREHFLRLEAEAALDQLQSPLDGVELMAMFERGPGLWIKVVKERLREMVIDGTLSPGDTATAERLARTWMSAPDDDLAAAFAHDERFQRGKGKARE
jgi:poly(A) polymerase